MKITILLIFTMAVTIFGVPSNDLAEEQAVVEKAKNEKCKEYTEEEANALFEQITDKLHKKFKKLAEKLPNKVKEKSKEFRKKIFKAHLAKINKHNKGKPKFCQVLNKFSAMDEAEFLKDYTGLNDEEEEASKPTKTVKTAEISKRSTRMKRATLTLVNQKDLTPPVEDQESCGNCWAYGSSHTFSGVRASLGYNVHDYSEAQIADCTYEPDTGCDGGATSKAFEWMMENRLYTETRYESKGGVNTPDTGCAVQTTEWNYHPAGWTYSVGLEDRTAKNKPGRKEVWMGMMDVLDKHPMVVGMNISVGGFKKTAPGAIFDTDLSCTGNNHVMTVVGYYYDQENMDNSYWIIKNSWGTDFCDDGYIRVKMGKNVCNVEASAKYPYF